MNKQQALKIIDESKDIYLNKDQKLFAKSIINSLNDKDDIQGYLDFIMKRTGLGFKFDIAPDIAEGRIAVVNEMKDKRINVSDIVDENENKLIIGENYEALKNLLLTHEEKIDIIYIDPPYNTESAKTDGNNSSKEGNPSKFIYKDKFGRNGWLNMMRERLVLAKRLLSPQGTIFVSIDDAEQAYLKILMDEIFGEENFIGTFPRQIASGGKNNGSLIAKEHDYIVSYSFIDEFQGISVDEQSFKLDDNDGRGKYQLRSLVAAPGAFERFGSQTNEIEFNGKKFLPKKADGSPWYWRWGSERVKLGKDLNLIVEKNGTLFAKMYLEYDFKQGDTQLVKKNRTKLASSRMWNESIFSNGRGSEELKTIGLKFPFPKPLTLIKSLISLIGKNAIILDFFAGSGTTGHAVLELNKEDGGNRKFILVTNNENNIGVDITYERLHRVIVGKTSDGKNDFEWTKNNVPFIGAPLRVFNIKHYNVQISEIDKLDAIKNEAIKNLRKLSPIYKPSEIDVYYDLDGLNPYNEEQLKQEYSTDSIEVKDEAN